MIGTRIQSHLAQVAAERQRRRQDPALGTAVALIKRYQHQRLQQTYADLLAEPRQAAAARFFLDELYGPQDFEPRDAQFARIVPTMSRLFGGEILQTVEGLSELHALSEQLDTRMGAALDGSVSTVDAAAYRRAWQATGRAGDRARQIELLGRIGRSLAHLTGKPMLRQSLRLMRGPARAAGLGDLQRFLETGFDTFRSLDQPETFLRTIEQRETRLSESLFEAQ